MNLKRAASDESLATLASCQVRIKRSATSVYDSRRNSIASMESCMTLQQSELDRLGKVYQSTISKSKRKSIKNRLKNFSSRRRRRSFGGASRQSSFTYVLITCFHESRMIIFAMFFLKTSFVFDKNSTFLSFVLMAQWLDRTSMNYGTFTFNEKNRFRGFKICENM